MLMRCLQHPRQMQAQPQQPQQNPGPKLHQVLQVLQRLQQPQQLQRIHRWLPQPFLPFLPLCLRCPLPARMPQRQLKSLQPFRPKPKKVRISVTEYHCMAFKHSSCFNECRLLTIDSTGRDCDCCFDNVPTADGTCCPSKAHFFCAACLANFLDAFKTADYADQKIHGSSILQSQRRRWRSTFLCVCCLRLGKLLDVACTLGKQKAELSVP